MSAIEPSCFDEPPREALTENADNCFTWKSGVTHVKVKEFKYTWVIKNFYNCHHDVVGEYLDSPRFYMGDNDEIGWALLLYVNGFDSSHSDYLSIGLRLLTKKLTEKILVTLSLVDSKGKENVYRKRLMVNKELLNATNNVFVLKRFLKKDVVFGDNNDFPNDELSINCKMNYCNHVVHEEHVPNKSIREIPAARRLTEFNDFEQLLENGKFSDVMLLLGEKEFCVHKSILAARSRVFAAMFEHAMKEQTDGIVEIADVEPEIMQELLRFIYAGKVNNIQMLACDLLAAADKYDLQGLKAECEDVIIDCLSVDNVGVIFNLIDRYDTSKLRTATLEFLTRNAKTLIDTKNFKTVMKSLSSSLLVDVINILMVKL